MEQGRNTKKTDRRVLKTRQAVENALANLILAARPSVTA